MNKLKSTFLFLVGFCCVQLCYSQANSVQVSVPPAPEAATFGKFGDIPVGEFTGSAQVNVPIYTIGHRGLGIPISLSYQSTGIRVSEEAGWTGLGWSLSTGGMITRTIRGYDDFGNRDLSLWCGVNVNNAYRGFWQLATSGGLPSGFAQDGEFSNDYYTQLARPQAQPNSSEQAYSLDNGLVSEEYFCLNIFDINDLQSDLYSYNLLGYAGKFIITSTGEIKFLEASDIEIEIDVNAADDVRWIATLPNGIKVYLGTDRVHRQMTYKVSRTFAVVDGAIDYTQFDQCYGLNEDIEPDQYISTWFIEKIVLPTQEVVNYNYAFDQQFSKIHPVPSLSETDKTKVESQIIWQLSGSTQSGDASPNEIHSGAMTYVGYDNILLESISIPAIQEEVFFRTSDTQTPTQRLDLSGARKLEKVEVIRSGQLYKWFDLTYDYFESDPTQKGWHQGDKPYLWLDNSSNTYYVDFDISPNVPIFYFEDDLVSKRLRLLSVQEKGNDDSSLPPYSFQYHDLPALKTSYAIDYWGYYNGRDQAVTFFPQVQGAVVPGPLASSEPVLAMGRGGADRSSTEDSKAGLLRTITYPTGGSTNFEYEQHRYAVDDYEPAREQLSINYKRSSSDLTDCSGGTIPAPTNWTYIDNGNPNVPLYFTVNFDWEAVDFEANNALLCQDPLCFYPLLDENDLQAAAIQFRFVVEDDVNGDIYYIDWDQNAAPEDFNVSEGNYDIVDFSKSGITIGPFPEGINYRVRLEPYNANNTLAATIPWNILTTNISVEWATFTPITERLGGGLRIKQLTSLTESGDIGSIKTYDYTLAGGATSGFAYSDPFSYYYEANIFNAAGTGFLAPIWSLGGLNTTDYANTYLVRSANSMHSLSNGYFGRFVGYSFVSISEGGPQNNGRCDKTFFTYGNQGFILNPLLRHYDLPSFAHQREGSILNESYYSNAGATVMTVDYTYNSNWGGAGSAREASDPRFSLEYGYQAFHPSSLPNTGEVDGMCSFTGSSLLLFIYAEAPQWHYLEEKVEKTYGEGGSFTERITEYDFEDNHFNLIEDKISGTGIEWTTRYKYAEELGSCILNENMTSIPLEIEAPNGVTYLTEYDCTYLVPARFTETYQDGSSITRTEVSTFDTKGYPLSIERFGFDTDEIYVWKPSPAPDGLLESKTYLAWTEEYLYNDFRQVDKTIAIDDQPIEYVYDPHGRLLQTKARPAALGSSSFNIINTMTYDMGGPNIVTSQTVYSDAPTQTVVSHYDGLGRPTKTQINGVTKEETLYDNLGRVNANTYLPGSFTYYTYDGSPLNRLKKEVYPDGNDVNYEYKVESNQWGTVRINERDFPTKSFADILGRQSKMIDAMNSETSYGYDNFGRLVSIGGPAGSYGYVYDDRNRLISKSVPGALPSTYCYDNATDLLCSSYDGNGNRISMLYDAYQRETAVYWKETNQINCNCNTSGNEVLTYQYDGNGVEQTNNPIYRGKLSYQKAAMLGASGNAESFYYLDNFGRTESIKEIADVDGNSITANQSHILNMADWLIQTQHDVSGIGNGGAYAHTFGYDGFGRVTSVNAAGVSTNMLYNDQDQMLFKIYDGGLARQDYEYNNRGWLTNINILRPEVLTPEDLLASRTGDDMCQIPFGEREDLIIKQQVTPAEFFELLCSGVEVNVPDIDPCPPVDPGDCFTTTYDSYSNELFINSGVFLFENETITSFFQNAKSQCNKSGGTLCIPYGFKIKDIKDIDGNSLGLNYDYDIINPYDTNIDCLPQININDEATRLRQDLINWLDSNGYDYDEVNVSVIWGVPNAPNSPIGSTRAQRLQFEVLGSTNFRLGDITLEYNIYCYDIEKGAIIDEYSINVNKPAEIITHTEYTCGPIGVNPITPTPSDSYGDFEGIIAQSQSTSFTSPTRLYEIITNDGRKFWMLEEELKASSNNNYRITKILPVNNSQQLFKVRSTTGQEQQTNLSGLLNQRYSSTYISDVTPVDTPTTTINNPSNPCPPPILGCDSLTQQAQENSLESICSQTLAMFANGTIAAPYNIAVVQLCNGEITYVLESMVNQITGNYQVLNTFPVDGGEFLIEVTSEEAFFAMEFKHQENGNISEMKWKVGDRPTSIYGYSYDPIDRVEGAGYQEEYYLDQVITPTNGDPYVSRTLETDTNNRYSTGYGYDAGGNITSIWRNGVGYACGPEGRIDEMTLTYGGQGGQQLITVQDDAPTNLRRYGFKPHPSAGHGSLQYVYDDNGNMTYDPHKILTYEYNFLNLPQLVRKGGQERLKTVYDATGRKWKKTSTVDVMDEFEQATGQTETETRVYVNGIEFYGEGTSASKLASINASADGRVAYNYDAGGAPVGSRVEYYHNDHLGNVRLAFSDLDGDETITVTDIYDPSNEITQERHYYPFGLTHTGPWYATVSPDNAYRYNGKELDEATGLYDYGARYYDPAIARWGQVDPLADAPEQVDKSPYAYAWNDPIKLNDPDGRCPSCIGAIVGAGLDYGIQVSLNLSSGQSWGNSFTNVDGKSILISAGTGALGAGLLSKANQVFKATTRTAQAAEMAIDGSVNVVSQLARGEGVDFRETGIAMATGQMVRTPLRESVKDASQATTKELTEEVTNARASLTRAENLNRPGLSEAKASARTAPHRERLSQATTRLASHTSSTRVLAITSGASSSNVVQRYINNLITGSPDDK